MTRPACSRDWEAEAARDGRLSGHALEDFRRHVARCSACALAVDGLEQFSAALRARRPPTLDDMRHRRLKLRVLEDSNRLLVRPGEGSKLSRSFLRVAAVLAGVVIAVGGMRLFEARPTYFVKSSDGARWEERVESGAHKIRLESGTLSIRVTHTGSEPRLIVEVPDGQIRDQGTRFSVTVASGRTQAIRVDEGAVAFRRSDGSVVELDAGGSWLPSPPPPPPSPAVVEAPIPSASASVNEDARSVGASANGVQPVTPRRHRSAGASGSSSAAVSSASPAEAGHDEEDMLYLRVLALVKEGRTAEARVAAQEYLRRFPAGFRRTEVQAVAR